MRRKQFVPLFLTKKFVDNFSLIKIILRNKIYNQNEIHII